MRQGVESNGGPSKPTMVRLLHRDLSRTDEIWIEHLCAGGALQSAALEELRDLVISGTRRALRGRAGADEMFLEDVAQETMVRTLAKLDQFEGRSRFTTWVTAIAIRVAHSELRRRHWRDISLEEVLGDPDAALQAPDAEAVATVERSAMVEMLHRLIETDLTERQRSVLLAELRGMPLEEIARRTGSNRNAVYKLTHDARRRLRRAFESAGYTASDIQSAFGG